VVGDFKYVVIFGPLQPDHVTQRTRNVLYCCLLRENAGLAWHSSDRTFTTK